MPSIKCRQCNLVNFSTETLCKRCGNQLNEYAAMTGQRPYQTSFEQNYQPQAPQTQAFQPQFEQNYQTQQFQTDGGQNYPTQANYAPQNGHQNPTRAFQTYQMPPSPVHYNNQHRVQPMHSLSCIKCGTGNGVAVQQFKKDYIPPIAFIGAIFGVLPTLILLLVLKVTHQIDVPFCHDCWHNFKKVKTVETLTGVGGLFGAFISILAGFATESLFVGLILMAGSVGLIIWGQMFKSKNSPKFKKVNRKEVVIADPLGGEVAFVR
jgi:hypothetical protein